MTKSTFTQTDTLTGVALPRNFTELETEINGKINALTTSVSGNGSTHGVFVNVKQNKGKITEVSVNDSNINFNNLVDNPIAVDDKGDFVIVDENGNEIDSYEIEKYSN